MTAFESKQSLTCCTLKSLRTQVGAEQVGQPTVVWPDQVGAEHPVLKSLFQQSAFQTPL